MDLEHLTHVTFSGTSEVAVQARANPQPFELRDEDNDPALAEPGLCVPVTEGIAYVRLSKVTQYVTEQSQPRDLVDTPDRQPPIDEAIRLIFVDGYIDIDAGSASIITSELDEQAFGLRVRIAADSDQFVNLDAVVAIVYPA